MRNLALFVDDGIIAAKSMLILKSIIKSLSKMFGITFDDCSNFVGLQICRDRINETMFIHQSAYTEQIIEKFGTKNSKEASVRRILISCCILSSRKARKKRTYRITA